VSASHFLLSGRYPPTGHLYALLGHAGSTRRRRVVFSGPLKNRPKRVNLRDQGIPVFHAISCVSWFQIPGSNLPSRAGFPASRFTGLTSPVLLTCQGEHTPPACGFRRPAENIVLPAFYFPISVLRPPPRSQLSVLRLLRFFAAISDLLSSRLETISHYPLTIRRVHAQYTVDIILWVFHSLGVNNTAGRCELTGKSTVNCGRGSR
jgi:hypothetical protein